MLLKNSYNSIVHLNIIFDKNAKNVVFVIKWRGKNYREENEGKKKRKMTWKTPWFGVEKPR